MQAQTQSISLLLVEGETEEEFFSALTKVYCSRQPKKIKNLRGNFNVNNKIVDAVLSFTNNNPEKTVDVYVCLDREKPNRPAYNADLCWEMLQKIPQCKARCNKVVPVIANLMIESIFFIDIDGIYDFLRAPKSRRRPKNFTQFRTLKHQDLSALFRQFGKSYHKGHRCENFVNSLALEKFLGADEINQLIKLINA